MPLVDAYHAFNVVPLDWGPARDSLYVTAGGYKYAAFGEGLCWLRIPRACSLRPVDTGWFADFASLSRPDTGEVAYGPGGARLMGATFDASPLYRADAALSHWERFGLDPAHLAPGPLTGTIELRTDNPAMASLSIPVSGEIVP